MPILGRFVRWGRALVLIFVGCAPGPEMGQLKIQASHDIGCSDKDDIHSKSLGDDRYEVHGCGRHARYHWICSGHGPMSPCHWEREPKS